MRKFIHVTSFLAALFCILICNVSFAQPVSSAEHVEMKPGGSAHHRAGKKLPADSRDKKAMERDQAKKAMMKKQDSKPLIDAPVPVEPPHEKPPKLVPRDKIKPVKDGTHDQAKLGVHKNPQKRHLKMQRMSKNEKELSPELKACHIDRKKCRKDCKAAGKICGKDEKCMSDMDACRKNCDTNFICQ